MERCRLHPADAMLCADRAAIPQHDAMDQGGHLVPSVEEGSFIRALRLRYVEVNIAVAVMAERDRARAGNERGHGCARLLDEARNFRNRHGNVVLDAAAFKFLHLGRRLPQGPEGIGLRLGSRDGGIRDNAFPGCVLQNGQGRAFGKSLGKGGRYFKQCIPGITPGERIAVLREVREKKIEKNARDEFKGGQKRASLFEGARKREAVASRLGRPAKTVATSAGRGKSFSVAAVMTPSVPSEPMSRLLRS